MLMLVRPGHREKQRNSNQNIRGSDGSLGEVPHDFLGYRISELVSSAYEFQLFLWRPNVPKRPVQQHIIQHLQPWTQDERRR